MVAHAMCGEVPCPNLPQPYRSPFDPRAFPCGVLGAAMLTLSAFLHRARAGNGPVQLHAGGLTFRVPVTGFGEGTAYGYAVPSPRAYGFMPLHYLPPRHRGPSEVDCSIASVRQRI